jgi:divalent metal cation (Fe/Co/Zn/Cd) transporter
MKKLKLFIEKWFPSILSFTLIGLLYSKIEFNEEFFKSFTNISTIIATVVIAFLITQKSIILAIDKEKHIGFKRLLKADKMTKRFFNYLNYPVYTSIVIIMYNICLNLFQVKILDLIGLFLVCLLILQVIRFVYIFNVVFEESLKFKLPTT